MQTYLSWLDCKLKPPPGGWRRRKKKKATVLTCKSPSSSPADLFQINQIFRSFWFFFLLVFFFLHSSSFGYLPSSEIWNMKYKVLVVAREKKKKVKAEHIGVTWLHDASIWNPPIRSGWITTEWRPSRELHFSSPLLLLLAPPRVWFLPNCIWFLSHHHWHHLHSNCVNGSWIRSETAA